MSECPWCHGRKGSKAFINRGPDIRTHSLEWRDCHLCGGNGTVDDTTMRRYRRGRAHRDARVKRLETLRECAARYGCTPAELSAYESGRIDLEVPHA